MSVGVKNVVAQELPPKSPYNECSLCEKGKECGWCQQEYGFLPSNLTPIMKRVLGNECVDPKGPRK